MSTSAGRADFAVLPAAALDAIDVARLAGRTILITGASGFVGSWLLAAIEWLNEHTNRPIRVHAVARRPGARTAEWLRWWASDVRELPWDVGGELVIHAAMPSTSTPTGGAAALVATAVDGTRAMLEHATRCGAERAVVLSSGAVYGGPHTLPISERAFAGVDPLQPGNEYAVAKLGAESVAVAYRRDTNLDVRIARLFTCIGAGYRSHAHLAHVSLIADACAGRPVRLRSAGRAVRSYLYGADLAVWLLAMLSREGPPAMNVGSDRALSILEFARIVARAAGRRDADVIVGQEPDAAPTRSYFVPDIAQARKTLGVDAWTSVEDAVHRMMAQLGRA